MYRQFVKAQSTIQDVLQLNPHTVSTNKKGKEDIIYAIQITLT